MSAKPIEALDVWNRQDLADVCLEGYHDSRSEIWLVFH